MHLKIAMLLKKHMIDYCEKKIGNRYEDLTLDYYLYTTLSEMEEIYIKIAPEYDGVITSGLIPHGYLSHINTNQTLALFYFRFDIENTYRIILQESVKRQSFDLSRIGLDFLPPGEALEGVIEDNLLPSMVETFSKKLQQHPIEALESFEKEINVRYMEQYKKGELDFIVTYFHSVVQTFENTPLNVYYLYPSAHEIEYVMHMMSRMVQLKKAKGSYPGVIRINLAEKQSSETMIELTMAEIQTTLLEYIKITQNSLSLKSGYHYFELYTDAETIRKLTGDFKHCALYPVLSEKTAFSGTIGYGIGMDFYHARSNAVDACRYDAAFADHDTVSYLINAEDLTTGLLKESSKAPGIVYDLPKDHIQKIAKEVKLSSETIFKIMGVLKIENTDTLTSAILIKRLDLSLRTANRYLTNLEKYGYAEIIGKQQPMGKGRPINIYRLFLLQ